MKTSIYSDLKQTKITSEQEDSLVAEAVTEWANYTQAISQRLMASQECWSHYLQNSNDDNAFGSLDAQFKSGANVKHAAISKIVDSLVSQKFIALLPSAELFYQLEPIGDLAKEYESLYSAVIEHNLAKSNFTSNVLADLLNETIDGVSLVWFPHAQKTRKKAIYFAEEPLAEELLPQEFSVKKKVFKDFVEWETTLFYPVAFSDWRVNPWVQYFEQSPLLWRRWVSPYCLQKNPVLKNTEDLQGYAATITDQGHNLFVEKLKENGITYSPHLMGISSDKLNEELALYERWGDFEIDGKVYENHLLIYSNDSTFHFFGENPFDHGDKPFALSSPMAMPCQLLGKSDISLALPLANVINTLYNQAIDSLSKDIKGAYLYDVRDTALTAFFKNKDSKEVAPGDLIPTQSTTDSLRAIQGSSANLQLISQLMQSTQDAMVEITGGVPYATGSLSGGGNKTLGEVEILAQATNTKFQIGCALYEKHKLAPFLFQMFENDRQFMEEPVFISDFELPLTPMLMRDMHFDIIAKGSKSAISRGRDINNIKELLMTIMPQLIQGKILSPSNNPHEIDVVELVKNLLAKMEMPNINSFLKKIEATAGAEQTTAMPSDPEPSSYDPLQQAGQASAANILGTASS